MDLISFLISGSTNPDLKSLDSIINTNSINYTVVSGLILLLIVLISAVIKKPSELLKNVLFFASVFVIVINTIYLAGSTIYLNQLSITKGPVHWHADFEVWNCGKQVDLINPTGWSNKIGTPVLHEHNDGRVHVEGVVIQMEHASLGEFFHVIGGTLTKDSMSMPTTEGMVSVKSGDTCNGNWGEVQVFVYSVVDNVYTQKKLDKPEEYVLSGHSAVPPGDCVIVEFDSEIKDKTEKMCTSYKVAKELGKIVGQ